MFLGIIWMVLNLLTFLLKWPLRVEIIIVKYVSHYLNKEHTLELGTSLKILPSESEITKN